MRTTYCSEHIRLGYSSCSNGCGPLLKKVDDPCSTLYSLIQLRRHEEKHETQTVMTMLCIGRTRVRIPAGTVDFSFRKGPERLWGQSDRD